MNTRNALTPTALVLSTLLLGVAAGCSSGGSDDPAPTTPGTGPVTPPAGTTLFNDSGTVPNVIDRMGRPGVSTALIRTDEDENAYNANGDPSTWAAEFTEPMVERVALIDTLDGVPNNALFDAATLTGLLVDDRLQIDTSVSTCDEYLAIEIGLAGCGGRTLERDVINDTLRHLVSQGMPVSDLAIMNDTPLPGDWPFLADPIPAQ